MRIIAGKYRSRILKAPKGLPVRPTTDRVKESLFNILATQYDFGSLEVLDLCCGTGNVSLEFLSRGVHSLVAVDRHIKCVQFVKKTLSEWEISQAKVFKSDIRAFIRRSTQTFDLIFADPPYDLPQQAMIIQSILAKPLLKPTGTLILEHSVHKDFSQLAGFQTRRNYGSSSLSFFQANV